MRFPLGRLALALFAFSLFIEKPAAESSYSYYCQGPLVPSSVRIGVFGGIVPSAYSHRSDNLFIGPDGISGIVGEDESPGFRDQFNLPWTIGLDVGYADSDNSEIFLSITYAKATGKDVEYEVGDLHGEFKFKSYSDLGLWAGYRYHFIGGDSCGCYFDPFIGFKVGAKFLNKVKADYHSHQFGFSEHGITYYQKETVPALGFQLGFSFNFCDCIDMVLMGEAIWSGQHRPNNKIFLGGAAGDIQAISVGNTGPVWSFPVTLGFVMSL